MNESRCGQESDTLSFPGGRGGGAPKVLLVRLSDRLAMATDGTVTSFLTPLDLPQLTRIGPSVSRMRVWWKAEGAAAGFTGNVTIARSIDGLEYEPEVNINAAPFTGATPVVSAWTTTDTSFGPFIRFAIGVANGAAGAILHGRVTAWLEIELKS